MTDSEILDWIEANDITISAGGKRWHVIYREGQHDKELLADHFGSLREALRKAKARYERQD